MTLRLNGSCPRCGADWHDGRRPIPEDVRHLHNDHTHYSRGVVVTDVGPPRVRCPDCGAEFPRQR